MFFEGWSGIIRIFIVGILAYIALIFWLRISGKRTLSKWNAFDFIVTIALGSTLASVILSKDVPLIEGILGLGILIGLQFLITWLSVRYKSFYGLVIAKPALLLDKGEFLNEAMKSQRVTEEEVRMAVRAQGIIALEDVEAVVLETDGSFSVIKKSSGESKSALKDVSKND
jgi:uncharacterized membrane protein YcaP (DUF421 family)